MGFQQVVEVYQSLEWQYRAIIALIVAALPFVVTYQITLAQSIATSKSNKDRVLEAPPVPYFIPWVGNTFTFVSDIMGTFKTITRHYNGIPVRLRLGPEKLYLVSGAQNIQALFHKSRNLSTKALSLQSLVTAFGMPSADAGIYEADTSGIYLKPVSGSNVPPERRVLHITHHQFGQELTGTGLAELSRQFIRNLATQINKKREDIGDTWHEMSDIFSFVRDESFVATTTALCGDHILRLSPSLTSDFWLFDSWLPAILKKVPRIFIPEGYALRDKCHQLIIKWHEYADTHLDCMDESLNDVLWEPVWGHKLMRLRAKMFKDAGVSAEGRAAGDLGMIWGTNANVVPSACWALIHVLMDASLTARIREEIAPAFPADSVESIDMTMLNSCPLLQSVMAEVLRLNIAIMINRTSTVPDFRLGNWFVEPGKIMLASIYFSHRDESIWNAGRSLPKGGQEYPLDSFWAERFLEYPNDPWSGPTKKKPDTLTSQDLESTNAPIIRNDKDAKFTTEGLKGIYIPFGGGTNMCPGRHYAKNEMLLVVAMLLWAFDIEFLDVERAKATKQSMKAFAVGTLTPDRQSAVRLKKRKLDGSRRRDVDDSTPESLL